MIDDLISTMSDSFEERFDLNLADVEYFLVSANKEELSWGALCDLQTLMEIRGGLDEGMMERCYLHMLHLMALAPNFVPPEDFDGESEALALQVNPNWDSKCPTVKKLNKHFKDRAIMFLRRLDNPYELPNIFSFPDVRKYIEWFQITEDEQRQLYVIHDEKVQKELVGAVVRRMKEKNVPIRTIAKSLGLNLDTVRVHLSTVH